MLIFANKEKQEIEKEISDQITDSEESEPAKSKINKNFGFKQIPLFQDYKSLDWTHFNMYSFENHQWQKINLLPYDKLEHILTIEEYKIIKEWVKFIKNQIDLLMIFLN